MSSQATEVNRLILRLASLACDVDEAVGGIEEGIADAPLADELLYADLPLLHLTQSVARLGRLVYGKGAA